MRPAAKQKLPVAGAGAPRAKVLAASQDCLDARSRKAECDLPIQESEEAALIAFGAVRSCGSLGRPKAKQCAASACNPALIILHPRPE